MTDLRVLSLSTLYPNDNSPGFGIFVERQMEATARSGDTQVVVINPIGLPPWPLSLHKRYRALRGLPAEEIRKGVRVLRPRYRLLPAVGGRLNPGAIARALLPLARRLHAEAPFDAVDAQFFWPDGPAAARIARTFGLPLSIKARGSDILLWGAKAYARRAMLAAAGQAAGLLSVSEALKRDMAALGMPADKIAVHYTGLDHALFRPLPRDAARALVTELLPGEGPLLVGIGNLIPLKGHHLAIQALTELPGVRLVIAGRGPEEQTLRAVAERLGLAERVALPGSIPPDVLAVLLNAADAMVLPSEREGLANAWIEALACGAPLVIADAGGAREVVRDASAGRIVEPNPAGIAAGVRELLANPPSPAAVAAHAARFSWEENAAQLAAHWHRIAGA